MKKIIKLSILLFSSLILIVGCSSNEEKEEITSKEEGNAVNKEENNIDEQEETSDEREEDQLDLKLGETGIVENVDKMEVTIDSPRFEEELGGFTPIDEIYLVMDVSIKNIGNTTFDGKKFFTPDVSTDDNNERSAYINPTLDEEKDGVKLLDGQLKPGDTVNGELIFSTKKAKKYKIAFGHESSQIVTKAAWEFSDSEVK